MNADEIPDLSVVQCQLSQEEPHPSAGLVYRVHHGPDSAWIHRNYDSHRVAYESGETRCVVHHPPLIEHKRKKLQLDTHAVYWVSPDQESFVHVRETPGSRALMTCYETDTGAVRWENEVSIERSSVPSDTTFGPESPEVFLAVGTRSPVLCAVYGHEDQHRLQVRQLSLADGAEQWRTQLDGVHIENITRSRFTGLFRTANTIGRICMVTGKCSQSSPFEGTPSQPVEVDEKMYCSLHTRTSASALAAVDSLGELVPVIEVESKRIGETQVYPVAGQPLLRVNQGELWFNNPDGQPISIRIRPWVYGVFASTGSPIFVLTDGQGGRLLAFDHTNGEKLLDIKPKVGGFGSHAIMKEEHLIVASESISRDRIRRSIRIVCTKTCKHRLVPIDGTLLSAANGRALIQGSGQGRLNSVQIVDLRKIALQ